MRIRLLVLGTFAGALVLFAWQFLSHGALKLPEIGLREFPNDSTATTAAKAIRALAPENGMYYSAYGAFAAVDISPNYSDKRLQFVSMLGKQFALDVAVAFLLTLMVDRLRGDTILRTAAGYGTLALAFAVLINAANTIWWSFSWVWAVGNVADEVIAFFLVGVTLAALHRRYGEPRIETAERPAIHPRTGVATTDAGLRM